MLLLLVITTVLGVLRHETDTKIGKLQPEAMITRKISMNEVEEKGFKTLVHDKDNHVKILVEVCP